MPSPCQAIVVGAGPVGLVAAVHLAKAGIPVLLVEKRAGLSVASLASTIHPPTLEILDELGILPSLRGQGLVAETIQYRTPNGIFAEFHMRDLAEDTRFPFRLHLEQARITPILLSMLRDCPTATVRFGCEVAAVSHHGGGVSVTLSDVDGTTVVEAPFLLAADGAHSAVRTALGIGFDGITYPDKALRIMTVQPLEALLPGLAPVSYLFHAGASVSFLHMEECWRIILRVPGDVADEQAMDEDWIFERFRAVLPSCTRLPAVMGKDIYRASRRVASTFGEGGAYLMGDAAHVTNTRGGMNMNCGIYDAVAMAGAVIAALDGDGGTALVDRVAAERRRVATDLLLPRTDRTVSGGTAWTEHLARTARTPAEAVAYLRTAAMLDMTARVPAHA